MKGMSVYSKYGIHGDTRNGMETGLITQISGHLSYVSYSTCRSRMTACFGFVWKITSSFITRPPFVK